MPLPLAFVAAAFRGGRLFLYFPFGVTSLKTGHYISILPSSPPTASPPDHKPTTTTSSPTRSPSTPTKTSPAGAALLQTGATTPRQSAPPETIQSPAAKTQI